MSTVQISLPDNELDFLQRYAQQQGMTVSDLIAGWARRLHARRQLHPQLAAITGILPANLDARDDYHRHVLDKHQ